MADQRMVELVQPRDLVIVRLAIVTTMVAFFRRSQIAGWLLVPYPAWGGFAAVLNFTIWQLNTG